MKTMNPQLTRTIIILSLFAATFFILQSTDEVTPTPIKKELSSFPKKIGDWSLISKRTSSEDVVKMLGMDDYIDYDYRSADGDVINLYISYYSALGVSGAYHSPLNCMPGGGVKISRKHVLQLSENKKINKMILSNAKKRDDAYYWYYTRGRTVYSEYIDRIYLVLDAIFKKRRDGSFIRIIHYPGKNQTNDQHVMAFVKQVSLIIEEYLPGYDLQEH